VSVVVVEVVDDDRAHRRVPGDRNHITWDHNVGWRVSSAAFEDDLDGVSIYLEKILEVLGLQPTDVLIDHAGFFLADLGVVEVRSLDQCDLDVCHHPEQDGDHPCDPAHGLILGVPTGKKGNLRARRKLAALARWIVGPDWPPPPEATV